MSQEESFNFSGEQVIYDDGVFRIQLPVELTRKDGSNDEGNDEPMKFEIVDQPYLIEWTTVVFEKEDIEALGGPTDTIEEVMRFLTPSIPESAPLKLIPMANGFNMATHVCTDEGKNRADYLLGEFVDENTFIGASLELTAPEEHKSFYRSIMLNKAKSSFDLTAPDGSTEDILFPALSHLLKVTMRQAYCSYGEPRINSSPEWLYVPKIGIRFPDELGTLHFSCSADYESTQPGNGVDLRYTDEHENAANIYVYDKTDELIEPGVEGDQVLVEMQKAVSEMKEIKDQYISELISEKVSSFGREEMLFLDKRFILKNVESDYPPYLSAILLTARLGSFIKIRFSAFSGDTNPENPHLKAFMDDLADVLS